MKNEHKRRGEMRVIHYGQIERKERVRESAVEEKERAPPPPPNTYAHTRRGSLTQKQASFNTSEN